MLQTAHPADKFILVELLYTMNYFHKSTEDTLPHDNFASRLFRLEK